MKGDAQVIDYLNKALLNELTAVNQYWLHYRMLDNWSIHKLAEYERHLLEQQRPRVGVRVVADAGVGGLGP